MSLVMMEVCMPAPGRARLKTPENNMRQRNNLARDLLARHERKCLICHHEDREAIEEEFIHWRSVWQIARQYGIEDYRSIYRHARATGLLEIRRENIRAALDNIVEHSDGAKVSGEAMLRAMRAYSCIDNSGRWIDPPSRVVFTSARAYGSVGARDRDDGAGVVVEGSAAEGLASYPEQTGLLPPVSGETADAPLAHKVEYTPVANDSDAGCLIYGTGIRNRPNSLKRNGKRVSNIR